MKIPTQATQLQLANGFTISKSEQKNKVISKQLHALSWICATVKIAQLATAKSDSIT